MATLILMAAHGWAAASGCPERVRIGFPDAANPPHILGAGQRFAEPAGNLVDWTRRALRKLGCEAEAELVRVPRRRASQMLEAGELDLLGGVADVGPLTQLVVIPAPPRRPEQDLSLGEIDYTLYVRRDQPVPWDGTRLGLAEGARVGVSLASHAEEIALERAWPREPAPSNESALQKLLAGRSAAMLAPGTFVEGRLREEPALAAALIALEPPVERRRLLMGAEPRFEARERRFVRAFWLALCRERRLQAGSALACALP